MKQKIFAIELCQTAPVVTLLLQFLLWSVKIMSFKSITGMFLLFQWKNTAYCTFAEFQLIKNVHFNFAILLLLGHLKLSLANSKNTFWSVCQKRNNQTKFQWVDDHTLSFYLSRVTWFARPVERRSERNIQILKGRWWWKKERKVFSCQLFCKGPRTS